MHDLTCAAPLGAPMIRLASVTLLLAATLLAGCAVFPTLPDGRRSAMRENSTALRAALVIRPPTKPVTLAYRPMTHCSYDVTMAVDKLSNHSFRADITLRTVGDKLQLIETPMGQMPDSYIIGYNGHLYDYNRSSLDFVGQRFTTDNSTQIGSAIVSSAQAQGLKGKNISAVNEFTGYFPEYLKAPLPVGDTVANYVTLEGVVWAKFLFSGVAIYREKLVAVIDLMRTHPELPSLGPMVIGFNLVDAQTGMPLLSIYDYGSTHNRFEQVSCDG